MNENYENIAMQQVNLHRESLCRNSACVLDRGSGGFPRRRLDGTTAALEEGLYVGLLLLAHPADA
jgi:hypothetical protein